MICLNYNNAVISNNYGSSQDFILFSKVPMGTRMNFFEIYRQFGASALRKFGQPCSRLTDCYVSKPVFTDVKSLPNNKIGNQ